MLLYLSLLITISQDFLTDIFGKKKRKREEK